MAKRVKVESVDGPDAEIDPQLVFAIVVSA